MISATMGEKYLTCIIDRITGKWPRRAPANANLKNNKENKYNFNQIK